MKIKLDLVAFYPSLAFVSPTPESVSGLLLHEVDKGTILFHENTACQGFPMILEGEVKVSRSSADGRTLELYRVQAGEICLVSAASLFKTQLLSGYGVATQATRLVLIPPDVFKSWLDCRTFRDEVLALFASRMSDLTSLIDAICFRKLDCRLASALLTRGKLIPTTHQQLADELGTIREIITRLLKRFENEGWIELAREQIQLVDIPALQVFAQLKNN